MEILAYWCPLQEVRRSKAASMPSHWMRISGAILVVAPSLWAAAQQSPPTTRVDNFRESFHGVELTDPYHWLEDSAGPETRHLTMAH